MKGSRLLGQGIAALTSDDRPAYDSLRDYLSVLEKRAALRRIDAPVDPVLEVTELCHRAIRNEGPALWFENPTGSNMPLVGNVYGTEDRVSAAIGLSSPAEFRAFGKKLAWLKSPELPSSISGAIDSLSRFGSLANVNPIEDPRPPCREVIIEHDDVDLSRLPIQHCWPDDAGQLITFGMVITRGPHKKRLNAGIYRQQVIGRNQLIMRWLHHRGGAIDFAEHQRQHPGRRFPVAVAIGADPAMTLAAVSPIPDTVSEFQFAGLLRGAKTRITRCLAHDLQVPGLICRLISIG